MKSRALSCLARVTLFFPALAATLPTVPAAAAEPEPAGRAADQADGLALLREWVPPVYPADALKARRGGMVNVRLIVDENGKPTRARAVEDSDEEFVVAALAAVNQWGFAPATESGKAVACCLETLVTFSPREGQRKASPVPPEDQVFRLAPRTEPKPTATPGGEYPEPLVERQLAGVVQFSCLVGIDGRAQRSKVLGASHADFVGPALRALEQWEFTPAMQGDLPIAAEVEARITFDSVFAKPAEVLAANGITAPDGTPPSSTPVPLVVVDPIWPLDLLLKGEGGSAVVEFTIRESGTVRNVRVKEASHPEFGHALTAAMEGWRFSRPLQDGQLAEVTLIKRHDFIVPTEDAGGGRGALARLVNGLRAGSVSGAKGLDTRLAPTFQVSPGYPANLVGASAEAGSAQIDFVVDREGRARLPKVVSATREEFGWAAATAVAQWSFQLPRRGGEPVDVKVRIPFNFTPPAQTSD
ncbi:MAG TPA: TonB family protein [Opitutus sp.]|nr:TonB family protein [Opitutus sp.]